MLLVKLIEPPCTERYARWCERSGNLVKFPSYSIYMNVPEDFEPVCNTFTEDGNEEHLVWIKADHPKKYYPEFFKTELDNPSKEVKHYVTKAV